MRLVARGATAVLFVTALAYAKDAGDVKPILAAARQRLEMEDSRATGHLVQVDANGTRVSTPVAVKAHWFPGVLRVLLEITPSQKAAHTAGQSASPDTRVSLLLEMRAEGRSTIQVFRPQEAAPTSLPVNRWNESIAGSDFNYEDFLQPEYFWQNQTFLKSARVGAHACDVLKSTPGVSDHSQYADVQTWLDHTIGYPIYVEKTVKKTAVVKEFTSFGLRQAGGVWSAKQIEVKIHGRPGSTLLLFERGSTKANLTLKDFSPEQISRFEDRP